jgi:phenylacetic acid degradation protein
MGMSPFKKILHNIMLYEFKGWRPVVDPSSFVHPQAAVTGNVIIGKNVYIGPGAAIRGDWGKIIIEDGCNVQESCTIHMFPGVTVRLMAGSHIGHGAIVHGATIGRNCLIGMNSVIMDNVVIGDESIVGALSFVKEGMIIPARSVVVGNPAKIVKEVSEDMLKWKTEGTAIYQALPREMKENWGECEAVVPGGLIRPEKSPDEQERGPGYRPWKETKGREDGPSGTIVEEPAAPYGRKKLTKEEYLEKEATSNLKHEYYKGDLFFMSGAKMDHNVITSNVMGFLANKLKRSGCQIFSSDVRVYVESEEFFTYPDLTIVCGKPITLGDDELNLMNPVIIIEVLSKSTADYDRNEKFGLYRGLPTLEEYLLIDSRSVLLEHYFKEKNNGWVSKKYKGLSDKLTIGTGNIKLPLEEIYANTRFPKLT